MIQRIAAAFALTLAPAAFAQTYLVADGTCGAVTLHATRGADFPNLGETIAADQVKSAYVSSSPSPGFDPGVKPWRLAMKPVAGAHSLDFTTNVDAHDEVVMAAVDFAPVVSGNETRTEHAKTFVFCGSDTPMADWQRSGGLGLEIYPQGWNPWKADAEAGRLHVVHRRRRVDEQTDPRPSDGALPRRRWPHRRGRRQQVRRSDLPLPRAGPLHGHNHLPPPRPANAGALAGGYEHDDV